MNCCSLSSTVELFLFFKKIKKYMDTYFSMLIVMQFCFKFNWKIRGVGAECNVITYPLNGRWTRPVKNGFMFIFVMFYHFLSFDEYEILISFSCQEHCVLSVTIVKLNRNFQTLEFLTILYIHLCSKSFFPFFYELNPYD